MTLPTRPSARRPLARPRTAAAIAAALLSSAAAHAAEGQVGDAEDIREPVRQVRIIGPDGTPDSVPAPPQSDVERYCTNIADPARDARTAIQMKRLQALEAEVNAKIDALEAKRAEVQTWMAERQAFLDSTDQVVLGIYATMKPDAAAAQLAGLDKEAAAALLARLKPRQAGAILSEMPTKVASDLTDFIVRKTAKDVSGAGTGPKDATGRSGAGT